MHLFYDPAGKSMLIRNDVELGSSALVNFNANLTAAKAERTFLLFSDLKHVGCSKVGKVRTDLMSQAMTNPRN